MAKSNEELDNALNQYLESGNIDLLRPFFGKAQGYEPYDEPELGNAINSGDIEAIKSIVTKLTTFDDSGPKSKNRIDEELDYVKERKDSKKQEAMERDIINTKKSIAKANKKSTLAKEDLERTKWEEKNLGKDKRKKENDKYLDDLDKGLEKLNEKWKTDTNSTETETVNSSEVNTMKLSKNDMKKLMFAMKTLTKHFAEENPEVAEEIEAATAEPETDDTTEDEGPAEGDNVVIELPQSIVDSLQEALDTPIEDPTDTENNFDDQARRRPDEDDPDDPDYVYSLPPKLGNAYDDYEDDGEAVYAACGTDFSEEAFYEFSEAITETVQNLQGAIEDISKKTNDLPVEEFIEEFSAKDFRSFAESVVDTLANINKRLDQIDTSNNQETPNKITTDLESLKVTGDDYEEEFITKSEENAANVDGIVENPEVSVVAQGALATTEPNKQFSKRYEAVKNFLNF